MLFSSFISVTIHKEMIFKFLGVASGAVMIVYIYNYSRDIGFLRRLNPFLFWNDLSDQGHDHSSCAYFSLTIGTIYI